LQSQSVEILARPSPAQLRQPPQKPCLPMCERAPYRVSSSLVRLPYNTDTFAPQVFQLALQMRENPIFVLAIAGCSLQKLNVSRDSAAAECCTSACLDLSRAKARCRYCPKVP
jgi:hypothetical protein